MHVQVIVYKHLSLQTTDNLSRNIAKTKEDFKSFKRYNKHELALRYEFHPCTTVLNYVCSTNRVLEHFIKQATGKKKVWTKEKSVLNRYCW